MTKLTLGSLFRLTAVAALGIAVANWWPRATLPAADGTVAWYHGAYWGRSYYLVTGTDSHGCTFRARVNQLPAYSEMIGHYPDGAIREKVMLMIKAHRDGCTIDRQDVLSGEYFAPDGSVVGQINNGTGRIKYCRPDGSPAQEIAIENGKVTTKKMWWGTGVLQSERVYASGELHGECKDYYSSGTIRAVSRYENSRLIEIQYLDENGAVANKPSVVPNVGY